MPANSQKREGKARARLTERQTAELQLEAVISRSAVRNWSKGGKVTENTDTRLRKACAKLGIAVLT